MSKSNKPQPMNELYFGDCLDVLKKFDEERKPPFIDLIYIDPPFNSDKNYNITFSNAASAVDAQSLAFSDTWGNVQYHETLNEIEGLDAKLYTVLKSFEELKIIDTRAIAYLTTMSIRIWYMRRYLKETGSFYLHCDPTMSHYLKMFCDIIFGCENFKNEIIWNRTTNSGSSKGKAKKFPQDHDVLLFYVKNNKKAVFFLERRDYSQEYINHYYIHNDDDGKGRYQLQALKTFSQERLEELKKENRIVQGKGKYMRFKDYLKDKNGIPINDIWIDIEPVNPAADEKLGYPTQKPEALLERIIKASSKEGDCVADFFCGCGTTVTVAEKLKRNWLGVDISHLAINVIEKRLKDKFPTTISKFDVDGFPKDLESAKRLASGTQGGRLKFQEWVVVSKLWGVCKKFSGDGGVDGYTTFELETGKANTVFIEVKSGSTTPTDVRSFCHAVTDGKADMGIFVCFDKYASAAMFETARRMKNFDHPNFSHFSKVQIIKVESLFEDNYLKKIFPTLPSLYKKAEAERCTPSIQQGMF